MEIPTSFALTVSRDVASQSNATIPSGTVTFKQSSKSLTVSTKTYLGSEPGSVSDESSSVLLNLPVVNML